MLFYPRCTSENKVSLEIVMGKFFLFSTQGQIFQISLHRHENGLTYQIDSADFKYEVRNSMKCHDVASFLPRQR